MSEIKRKLASVQVIESLTAIPDADNIETARVLGWDVVVKKGTFKVGDYCVFFEIDSFLPAADPRYNFLLKSAITWEGKQGIRLKTIKLRKQISQGLVLPLSDFPEINEDFQSEINSSGYDPDFGYDSEQLMVGFDVTELLGILKWERAIPAQLSGRTYGNFPTFIPKTDEERIQNIFRKMQDSTLVFEVTEKLDGSSMTIYLKDGELRVCSRNWDMVEDPNNAFWACALQNDLKSKLLRLADVFNTPNIAVQGELIGAGVQGNRYGFAPGELKFYVFNIYNIDEHKYVQPGDRRLACNQVGFDHTPVIEYREFDFDLVDDAVAYADGMSQVQNIWQEGVVFKSLTSDTSFKIISNKFLLEDV